MFAVTGMTGQVGAAVADHLLKDGAKVRAVVRNPEKAAGWKERGCTLAVADMNDVVTLTSAFRGAEAVFLVIPPLFDPSPGFPEVKGMLATLKAALEAARPGKLVCLSTVGAQATQPNLLSQLGIVEKELSTLSIPVAFLRAGWFMENAAWDVAPARESGVIASFLQPLDRAVPMIAVDDIGALGAKMLREEWQGVRVVELEGPERVSPAMIAAAFAKALDKPVTAEAVPQESWEELFRAQGMKNPEPRMRMLDGFNEGWIDFEGGREKSVKGATTIETAIRRLVTGA
ncbi:NmrA family NAD(P)-binding protein [Rhizobium mesosinicum]|uniref:NmrA family NAD(P)-binding protein n=1 Tax=Rhizobium mesosinicum TaxID=335017 RepID=A0ABS7GQD8_9HYPH|nr:NmrA family NAD(P)-binding protein [Rhizobium mesosinicum]MBW9052022.1 NmrA family NAD(P)-binding protein [Rhizobium mesosinicum]